MKKSEFKQQASFVFDEKGAEEVSTQIMNSYNSGFINKEGLHGELNHSRKLVKNFIPLIPGSTPKP